MSWTIKWTKEKKDQAIAILSEWFSEHGPGECIMQSDESLITAPEVLAQIADEVIIEGEGMIYNEEEE